MAQMRVMARMGFLGLCVFAGIPSFTLAGPGPGGSEPLIGGFRNTYYYLLPESDFSNYPQDTHVLDIDGNVLATVSAKYKKAMDIEGSGKLLDGRVVNFFARVNGEIRYRVVPDAYGRGVGTCPLEPFHSIAVDPKQIPLGATVRIEETVGMRLPSGKPHNGLWKAVDIGGAIKGDRIDLFVGAGEKNGDWLDKAGITHLQALTLRLVQAAPSHSCVDEDPASR